MDEIINELEYYTFVLGRDFLVNELQKIENDIAYAICKRIATVFMKSCEYYDLSFSGYESLENFVYINNELIHDIINNTIDGL